MRCYKFARSGVAYHTGEKSRRRPQPVGRRARDLLVLAAIVLSGCTSTLVDYEARTHVVQPGETLYTIAWRHGVDHRVLARWNGLSNPDLIYVGQRLRLSASGQGEAVAAPPSAPPTVRPRPLPPPPALPAPSWQWPVRGPLVGAFGASGGIGNGIGIAGELGQDVRAAAAGRVVYAGSGLIGYGQLVIIKHNETYLSAYGHNSRLVVAQGDDVALGQVIGEMGMGPRRRPQLHFEIRRNGTPVNPLEHLPR